MGRGERALHASWVGGSIKDARHHVLKGKQHFKSCGGEPLYKVRWSETEAGKRQEHSRNFDRLKDAEKFVRGLNPTRTMRQPIDRLATTPTDSWSWPRDAS